MPFEFRETDIADVVHVRPEVFEDDRGFLLESYDRKPFREHGIDEEFVLELYSQSRQDVVRGLHFQRPPHAQAKLVQCVQGRVYDVAVDLRDGSATFGEHVAVQLSGERKDMLYIPAGFAHGFAVLSEIADILYRLSDRHAPEAEDGVRWDDPALDIDWPVPDPIVSEKDDQLPALDAVSPLPSEGD